MKECGMKKKLFLAIIGSVALVHSMQGADTRKLYKAIEESDVASFAKLYKDAELDNDEKKALVKEAEEVIELRKEGVSFLKSPADIALWINGTAIGTSALIGTIWGAIMLLEGSIEVGLPSTVGFGALSGYGFYKAFCGLLCKNAYARVTAARKILDEMDKKKETTGVSKKKKNH